MYKSYLRISWRNIVREKSYSFINIGGLALGMSVAILIGLWVYDELSFDKHQDNYSRVAAVMQNNTLDGIVETWSSQSYQLGLELRNTYSNYFKYVAMCSFPAGSILKWDDKAISSTGCFMEKDGPQILDLRMTHGTRNGIGDNNSILLSESVAKSFFGDTKAVGNVLRLDDDVDLKVTGVYQDIPNNSSFRGEFGFIAPLDIIVNRGGRNFGWVNSWLQVFVQMNDDTDPTQASAAIKDLKLDNVGGDGKGFEPELFVYPLSQWRLHSDFKNGVSVGGPQDSATHTL